MLNRYFYSPNFGQVESQEIAVHGISRRALARPPITGELAREKDCLPAATSYGEERGNSPDTYRGDQREARLVRNLYHIFLLYTTIVPSLSSSSQNRFRSVRGRAQWAQHGESSTSSERKGACEGENNGIRGRHRREDREGKWERERKRVSLI